MSWIGLKEVKNTEVTDEKTQTGAGIVKVTYQDDTIEHLSEAMYDKVVTEASCSLEELRAKRCQPVVAMLLSVLSEWGIKLSELPYISALLNQSLEFNKNAATNELWANWMPKPTNPEEVDLIAVDRVLRSIAKPAKDYGTDDGSK